MEASEQEIKGKRITLFVEDRQGVITRRGVGIAINGEFLRFKNENNLEEAIALSRILRYVVEAGA